MGQTLYYAEFDIQFNQKASLIIHERSVHLGQKFKCPECDFCTDTETLFQAHAVANHPLCSGNLLKRIDNFSGAALKGDNNFPLQGIL